MWAAIHECGVARTNDKHRTVSDCLLHDNLRTCIDLAEIDLNRYFKRIEIYKNVSAGQIIFVIPQRNAMMAFVQWVKEMIRSGEDPSLYQFEKKEISELIQRLKTHEL